MSTEPAVFNSDVASALDAAEEHAQILDVDTDIDGLVLVAHRNDRGIKELDLERYLDQPTRRRGTVTAHTAAGFINAYNHRIAEGNTHHTAIYADIERRQVVAVLNDDADGDSGWRDDRITYEPQLTPDWTLWMNHQGLHPQEHFAEIIEAGEAEIREPSATVMLEIAQTFEASIGARFKQHGRLRDGLTQFVYEEEIEATAKTPGGAITIPDFFVIELRPFYGAEPRLATCRIRYRLKAGQLTIGYTITRPEDILRDAFEEDVISLIGDALAAVALIEGVPADPVRPGR